MTDEFPGMDPIQGAELAFAHWSMLLHRPTESTCVSCHHPESRCVCGYIAFRDTQILLDTLRLAPRHHPTTARANALMEQHLRR